MSTPEGTIKAKLDRELRKRPVWRYSPQAGPFGKAGVPDRLVLCTGMLVGIECKADKTKKPTALQVKAMEEIEANGGKCFVVYDGPTIESAVNFLDQVLADAGYREG